MEERFEKILKTIESAGTAFIANEHFSKESQEYRNGAEQAYFVITQSNLIAFKKMAKYYPYNDEELARFIVEIMSDYMDSLPKSLADQSDDYKTGYILMVQVIKDAIIWDNKLPEYKEFYKAVFGKTWDDYENDN